MRRACNNIKYRCNEELIADHKAGLLFKPVDSIDLQEKIIWAGKIRVYSWSSEKMYE
jgi:hypothetical protein